MYEKLLNRMQNDIRKGLQALVGNLEMGSIPSYIQSQSSGMTNTRYRKQPIDKAKVDRTAGQDKQQARQPQLGVFVVSSSQL
jgi:hypothetical protein